MKRTQSLLPLFQLHLRHLFVAVICCYTSSTASAQWWVPPSPAPPITVFVSGTSVGEIWDCQIVPYEFNMVTMNLQPLSAGPWLAMAPEYMTVSYNISNVAGGPTSYQMFTGRHTRDIGSSVFVRRVFFHKLLPDGSYSVDVPPVWIP